MHSCFRSILASGKLIPFIIRQAVTVHVKRYHHYSRLTRTSLFILHTCIIERIAENHKIIFPIHINHRVVKTKRYITTECTKRHHLFIRPRQCLFCLTAHILSRIPFVIPRHLIDKLTRSRTIFIDMSKIWTIGHLFIYHIDRKPEIKRVNPVNQHKP